MIKKILLILTFVLSACDTTPNHPQQVHRTLTPFEACVKDVRSAALSCTLRCMGAGGNCHQICDDRQIAQMDRCEARQKGISHQYSPPTQPQQIIIQQQQPVSNPNACIQDGGSVFCPNHPSNRSTTPLYRPVFK